jgi:hypothetical protein
MRVAHRAIVAAMLVAGCESAAAIDSGSGSLDDNPQRHIFTDVPLSWLPVRWEAGRVNHVLDILFSLGGCECEEARAILESDLRGYERDLQREIAAIQDAQSKGKVIDESVLFVEQQKPTTLIAAEAQERARQYWASRRAKSNARQRK